MDILSASTASLACIRRSSYVQLIAELQDLIHTNSKFVSLEEQVTIFLYSCVTDLTLKHIGEQFQQSSDTISLYFQKILVILLTQLLYSRYVQLPTREYINSSCILYSAVQISTFDHSFVLSI
ncbi:hypothetical protein PAXRUDRAFT_150399 [Paxillus rubicundulus Ve08.2h10]|uniref:DUF8040 domain-containing protein n=1 Tax=Paxillus rubicundulus Ve08.2h10 TaxID=930991 RepID=A0A0D0E2L0_9AGAM|nr:hypothetical protein PAXRUDRAFT_150399 [Paxillus rubicundulus Ve08.2h10]